MSSTVELVTDRAPSVDLTVYRKEIFNFLKTVLIKYDPLVTLLNDRVIAKGGEVDESNPETWKYYLNAVGKYHPTDTPMYIVSLDTKEKMLFSNENLLKSPRTLEAYSIDNTFFTELCSLHPDQVDLIRGIRYPISDWEVLYNADNLTYIYGDTTILEENERDSLENCINKVLKFIEARWYFPAAEVESLYPIAFYGFLWDILAMALFAQRYENIKTPEVHSWHVWQYITSKGLADYSDLLTFSQSMFLYRNLDYLNQNRGKQSNLLILADNLLQEWSLSLYGRYVIQRTDKGEKDCLLYPDLIAKVIPTKNASDVPIPLTTVTNMVYKLIEAGDDIPAADYPPEENAARQERILSDTTVNTYPTKVVEISPVDRNKKYADQFDTYIYDTLVYGVASGLYTPAVEIPSMISQKVVQLSAQDCLLLFNYCMFKSLGAEVTDIPTVHKSALALKQAPVDIVEWYRIGDTKWNINGLLNLYDYTNGNFQMNYAQPEPTDFSKMLLKGFETLVHQTSLQRLNADTRIGIAQRLVTKNMSIIGDVKLNFTTAKTYTEWFSDNPDILTQIVAPIEANEKTATDNFTSLASNIINTLVPIISGFNVYGDYSITDTNYKRLIELFKSFTSYNITFVDDNTASPEYFFTPQRYSSIWQEMRTGTEFYGELGVTSTISDKITNIIGGPTSDRLGEIVKDVLTEPYFDIVDSVSKGAIVKDTLSETLYQAKGSGTIVNWSTTENDVIKGAGVSHYPDLTLPDVYTPSKQG